MRKRNFHFPVKTKTILYQGRILMRQYVFFCFIALPSKKVISGESIFTKAKRRTNVLRILRKYDAVFTLIDILTLYYFNLYYFGDTLPSFYPLSLESDPQFMKLSLKYIKLEYMYIISTIFKLTCQHVNSFQANFLFLYPLMKTSENLRFFDLSRGYINGFLTL